MLIFSYLYNVQMCSFGDGRTGKIALPYTAGCVMNGYCSKREICVYCCSLQTAGLCTKYRIIPFTFIAQKFFIFFLHSSQKCTTFALDLKKSVTITIKPNKTKKL